MYSLLIILQTATPPLLVLCPWNAGIAQGDAIAPPPPTTTISHASGYEETQQ